MVGEGSLSYSVSPGHGLSLLGRVARAASSASELGELLQRLLAELTPLFPCQSLGFSHRDAAGGYTLTLASWSGPRALVERTQVGAAPGDGQEADLPFYSRDNSHSPHPVLRWMEGHGFRASLYAPVTLARQRLGWLIASRTRRDGFQAEELGSLVQMAEVIAPALNGLRLQERLEAAYRELATAKDELTRSERLTVQLELAYGVVHDINNILGLIAGRVDLLGLQPLPAEAQRSVETIRGAIDDGINVIRRINQFTRQQRDQELAPLDLNRIVAEALEMARPRLLSSSESRRPAVAVRLEEAPGLTVMGVASELRQMVVNLVINAVDAMPSGGDLSIRCYQEGPSAVLCISDTGCGMVEEVRQRVFEPFFTTKGKAGSGLGLWVSRGIITRHWGEIEVHSQPGQGTSFIVRLPAVASAPAPTTRRASDQRSILVVDDEAGLAEALKLCLEVAGYQVDIALDGAQALEALEASAFDLVITDLRMPGMPGWELAARIKKLRPGIPVIAMTGWPVHLMGDRALEVTFDLVVQKPWKVNDLRAVVARLLGNGRGN